MRAELLRLLFVEPAQQRYVRELMNMSGLALHTIQDELRKLSALGLVTSRSNGFHRYYLANRSHPLYSAVRQIVALSSQSPRARVADLRRAPGKRSSKRNRKPRRAHLKLPYGPVNWGTLQKKS